MTTLSEKKIDARKFIETEQDYIEDYPEREFFLYPANDVEQKIQEFLKDLKEERCVCDSLEKGICRFCTFRNRKAKEHFGEDLC